MKKTRPGGAQQGYPASSEIMKCSLGKTQRRGWIARMDGSWLGMGKEKKEGTKGELYKNKIICFHFILVSLILSNRDIWELLFTCFSSAFKNKTSDDEESKTSVSLASSFFLTPISVCHHVQFTFCTIAPIHLAIQGPVTSHLDCAARADTAHSYL